jgi:toxin ParE1/3/4
MPKFRLSKKAEDDISGIARYTIDQFGVEQARSYRDSIIACFQYLAESPGMGRKLDKIREGYQRFDHRSHVIFYKSVGKGILIIRVLHKRMDAPQHL